jgi:hypothetical protein
MILGVVLQFGVSFQMNVSAFRMNPEMTNPTNLEPNLEPNLETNLERNLEPNLETNLETDLADPWPEPEADNSSTTEQTEQTMQTMQTMESQQIGADNNFSATRTRSSSAIRRRRNRPSNETLALFVVGLHLGVVS